MNAVGNVIYYRENRLSLYTKSDQGCGLLVKVLKNSYDSVGNSQSNREG